MATEAVDGGCWLLLAAGCCCSSMASRSHQAPYCLVDASPRIIHMHPLSFSPLFLTARPDACASLAAVQPSKRKRMQFWEGWPRVAVLGIEQRIFGGDPDNGRPKRPIVFERERGERASRRV
jgi:hypothetical protein